MESEFERDVIECVCSFVCVSTWLVQLIDEQPEDIHDCSGYGDREDHVRDRVASSTSSSSSHRVYQ